MRRFCVIGDPIEHSRSPELYQAIFRHLGLDWVYIKQKVLAADCADFLKQVRQGCFDGFNATMPHKELLVPLMDELTPVARRAGSVNTVKLERGTAVGHSTDGAGVVGALDELGAVFRGETVCLLGAGGAALAAAAALLEEGAARLIVCNRTVQAAVELAEKIGGSIITMPFTGEALYDAAHQSAVMVNCTSLGMKNGTPFPDLGFLQGLSGDAAVYDMVYVPSPTEFVQAAQARGLRCANGEAMLLHQAVAAMEFYLGQPLDRPAICAAVYRELEANRHRGESN